MAVRRSQNWINQQRVDVPHLRSIESAIRSDFDELIGAFAIGEGKSYFIRGFELNTVGAVGSSASALQLIVEDSSLFHGSSNSAGTFFQVPNSTPNETLNSTTNTKVQGSFTPSTTNYIGIEFVRAINNATAAQIFLWNPTNKTEISKTVPLAETFDYNIIITSSTWASNVMPLALIDTDGSNNVVKVDDRRDMFCRLGSAGSSTPDPFHKYPWNDGREENFYSSTTSISPFQGGDKQLLHLKDWMDAMMSMMQEVKGTSYWYSENKGGSLIKMRGDLAHTQMTGSGKFTHALSTAGQINWTNEIFLNFIGSRLNYKIDPNELTSDITLANNQVAYFKIIRGVDIVPNLIFTNGSAEVKDVSESVSWTSSLIQGDFVKIGSEDDTKYFEILSVDSAFKVTLTENWVGTSTGSSGIQAKYAYGVYQTDASPSTDRHIRVSDRKDVPFEEDTYWMFLRADNGSTAAKVYIRGSSGGELEQGEEREISDNQTSQILEYTGAPSEVDATPNYTNAIVAGVAESRTITFPIASALGSGQYFTVNSAVDLERFYVYAIIDSNDIDPAPADLTRVAVNFLSTDSAAQVATKYHLVLDAIGAFNSTDNGGNITLINSQFGESVDAVNIDMGAGFSVITNIDGVGAFNHVLVDDENLTKGIKRLDGSVQGLAAQLDAKAYEEPVEIVAGVPANDREVTGPVVAGVNVKIPKNTRNSNVQESYVSGAADLEVYLNGAKLCVNDDYIEIVGTSSTNVQFSFGLTVGDTIKFVKVETVGAAGGGGAVVGVNLGTAQDADVFKQVVGSQMQFRRLAAGSNITISQDTEKVTISSSAGIGASSFILVTGVNHTLLTTQDGAIVSNVGADRTITLPDAVVAEGKVYNIKKIDAGNTTFVKSVSSQTLDGVDIDAAPYSIVSQFANLTIVAVGGSWFIL